MRSPAVFALLGLIGCAASHPQPTRPTTESVRVAGQGSIRMGGGDGAMTGKIPSAPDKVWSVLAAVYDSLSIPVATVDPARRLLGNTGFRVHQKLGKTSLAKLIDCGKTQGFPSADSYDVYLTVTSQVQPAAEGASTLSTLLEAAGRPMAYSGEYSKCTTTGALEAAIVDGVRARLK